ncbi:MAG: uroporphyrinogen-III C-methyltransferase [Candidatus Wenzhouxiangella sp. M2_3B_020]
MSDSEHEQTDTRDADEQTGRKQSADEPGPERKGRGGAFAAVLALLLAVAALALAARPWWPEDWRPGEDAAAAGGNERIESLGERVDRLARRIDDQEQRDDGLAGSIESTADRVGEIDEAVGSIEERIEELSSIRTRIDDLGAVDERVEELAGRLEDLRSDFGDLAEAEASEERSMESLREQVDQLSVRFERVQGERNSTIAGLRTRLDDLERTVSERLERFDIRISRLGGELESADRDLVTRLRLIEIQSLLSAGRNRLEAFGDVDAARQAWARAARQLRGFESSRFGDLRSAVEAERERLQSYDPPSSAAHVQRLYDISEAVGTWAGIRRSTGSPESPEEEGWSNRLGSVMSRLVKVESVADEAPGAATLERLRTEIRAGLQTAALALARRDYVLAERLIAEAAERMERAFDESRPEVLTELDWLRGLDLDAAADDAPELDESMQALDALLEGAR